MTNYKTSLDETNLFKPIKVGNLQLEHRAAHAATSRARSVNFTPTDIMLKYYDSRSKYAGTLIVVESVLASRSSGLVPFKSGLWLDSQAQAFRKITDSIHANGSYAAIQLFSPGRTANLDLLEKHLLPFVAPSAGLYVSEASKAKALEKGNKLRALSVEEIHEVQNEYVASAVNAVTNGNFDIIEIHGGSGHLVEQFLSPIANIRSDKYGGSVENRARFVLELIDKLIEHPAIGASRVALRLSPWSDTNGMVYPENIPCSENPTLLACQYIAQQLQDRADEGKEVAYLSVCEPRVSGSGDADPTGKSNESIYRLWKGVLMRTGGYATNFKGDPLAIKSNVARLKVVNGEVLHYQDLIHDVNVDDRTLIGFSRPFTSNPDLVTRLQKGWKLDVYDRDYFYSHTVDGYLTFGEYNNDEDNNHLQLSPEELSREGVPLV
ncbi:NAPDH dehydrogenase (old yellow enzyme) (OYE32) (OYE32) [Scheffersomyces stipitis CBS 6054]|uniref:NAPDH dehydrogenase (Old yellow enzyme) (OYE32) (OYE32) n=1 Tax=Scheffersomyces stipitis (strain ATCC 58785 / CBS 6054 / NBRC 10063 / NRRL Y-11545) TaxID=322104 RepID=A3GH18_PICST|nr:NAPDH dehydrogenase (old yellow enzyme) (OYE32) (OYE32) [Scheffersomyces stipitis CBS 6054]EAZ64015.2 NAPDH dehydrogenase (old yellow enzyme) (OYE32) (OYE32) [Scheffersomyces stipitis CBS 6054]